MKIALTGGNGRLGRAIAEGAVRQGHHIVSVDRDSLTDGADYEKIRHIEANTDQYERLADAFTGCDALIHMAAIPAPGHHPDHILHNNNVVGSYNVLRAGIENGIERICLASSVNAIGLAFGRVGQFDYFPIDERHQSRVEDPYSLSKWLGEQQADSFARRYEGTRIASMRFHYAVEDRTVAARVFTADGTQGLKQLWGYVRVDAAVRACLLSLTAAIEGHEVFNIVAPDTTVLVASRDLALEHFPDVPIRGDFGGTQSFFTSAKAEDMLGWCHEPVPPSAGQRLPLESKEST